MKVYREQSSEQYLPAWHGRHTDDADREYVPSGHMFDVELVLPEAQAYPAGQAPLHADDCRPAVAPNEPPGHTVHAGARGRLY